MCIIALRLHRLGHFVFAIILMYILYPLQKDKCGLSNPNKTRYMICKLKCFMHFFKNGNVKIKKKAPEPIFLELV